jgi:hypothetical protein
LFRCTNIICMRSDKIKNLFEWMGAQLVDHWHDASRSTANQQMPWVEEKHRTPRCKNDDEHWASLGTFYRALVGAQLPPCKGNIAVICYGRPRYWLKTCGNINIDFQFYWPRFTPFKSLWSYWPLARFSFGSHFPYQALPIRIHTISDGSNRMIVTMTFLGLARVS